MGVKEVISILANELSAHMLVGLFSALFFYVSFRLLLRVIKVHEKERVVAANTAVSLIHGCITGIWALFSVVGIMNTKNYMGTSLNAEMLLSFILGFFVFDIYVFVAYSRDLKLAYAFILHHICAFATYGGCVWYREGVHYCIMAVTSEVSNIFLHSRKLMHYEDVSRTNIFYLVNTLLGLFTAFTSRILSFGFVDYQLAFVEPYIPGLMGPIVAFGNVPVFCFTVFIFRALLKDFTPRVDRAKNGNVPLVNCTKDE